MLTSYRNSFFIWENSLNFPQNQTQVWIVGSPSVAWRWRCFCARNDIVLRNITCREMWECFPQTSWLMFWIFYIYAFLLLKHGFWGVEQWLFLLSICTKVVREQPCWSSTVNAAWMLPDSLWKRHSLHYGNVFTEIIFKQLKKDVFSIFFFFLMRKGLENASEPHSLVLISEATW